jgi:hypothetical protein
MDRFEQPQRFKKCPVYMPRETAQGYLGRLTAFFGSRSPKHFCKDYMLDLTGIQHGEPEALRRLAAMTGGDPEQMIRCTPRRIGIAYMELCGEILNMRVNPRYQIRICPVCAKEDIAANPGTPIDQAVFMRCEWTIGGVDACHRHKVKLATYNAQYSTSERFDVGYEAVNLLEALDSLPVEPAELDEFQLYLLGRLGAVEGRQAPFLDPMPLVIVTQICLAAGLDLLQRRGADGDLSDNRRRGAGFDMLGHDQEALDRCIVEMRHGMAAAEMATRILPRLLEYMNESIALERKLGSFPDALAATLFRLLHYKPGQVVLGRVCQEATLYHFLEARRVYGLQASHLHAFIAGTPELATKAGPGRDNYLIDREVADRLFRGRTPFQLPIDMARHMGRGRVHARKVLGEMVDAGIIRPEPGASRNDLPPLYSLPGTESDLAAFVERFEPVDPGGACMIGIDAITGSYGVTSSSLWRLLASGQIKRMGMVSGEGFLTGLRLDLNEVIGAIAGVDDPVRIAEAASMLGVRESHVRNLVANGFLEPGPGNPDLSCRLMHVFARATIQAFDAEYVSNQSLRKQVGTPFAFGVLVGRGLAPAISLDAKAASETRTIFYRRAQAEALLT